MYVHVVKKGESMYRIGRMMGVPREDIAWINEIESETFGQSLLSGRSLLIPTQVATTLFTYTVQPRDTLRQVAHRFRIPETMVLAANPQLHAEELRTGRVLTLPVPIQDKHTIEVNLRLHAKDGAENVSTIRKADTSLSTVSLCSGVVLPDGLLRLPPACDIYADVVRKHSTAKPFLTLTPTDEQTAMRLLVHEPTRRTFFSEVRIWIGQESFAGVHLEFTRLPPKARELLPGFVRELAVRVHQKQCLLYLAIPLHFEDDPENRRFGAYDLPWLSLYADRIVWNAELSSARLEGPPTALAPLHLIKRSLSYALQHVPNTQLLLGLPFYGYDWSNPWRAGSKSYLISGSLPEEGHGWEERPKQIYWDERAMSPMYTYRDAEGSSREVWYEDVRSSAAKLHLVQELQLAGVSCHVVGASSVAQWSLLLDNFRIRKFSQKNLKNNVD